MFTPHNPTTSPQQLQRFRSLGRFLARGSNVRRQNQLRCSSRWHIRYNCYVTNLDHAPLTLSRGHHNCEYRSNQYHPPCHPPPCSLSDLNTYTKQKPETRIMDPHSQFITHPSGETTHYIADCHADPWKPHETETVLLQGGFARHSAFFYHWVPALSRHYRVIRRDLRGHGLSSAPSIRQKPDAYTLDTILSEILDTLDQLNIQKVHFFGESTSGILGEIFAARHPERLLSLTVCSSPTHLPQATQDFLAMGIKTTKGLDQDQDQDQNQNQTSSALSWPEACRRLGSRGWAQALSERPGTMASNDPAYRKWWLDEVSVSSGEGLASYAEFLCTIDSRPILDQIRVPMLILAPTRSAATTIAAQKEIQQQIGSNCKLVEVDGPGHEIYIEAADDCIAAFLDFVKRMGP